MASAPDMSLWSPAWSLDASCSASSATKSASARTTFSRCAKSAASSVSAVPSHWLSVSVRSSSLSSSAAACEDPRQRGETPRILHTKKA
eukprot:535993-Rhodomonas_salina.3